MKQIQRGDLRAPAAVLQLDSSTSSPQDDFDVSGYETAYALVRREGWPTAMVFLDVSDDDVVEPAAIVHLASHELPAPQDLTTDPGTVGALTVAICTRDRQEGLRATLESLAKQSDRDFVVIVADNATVGGQLDDVVDVEGLDVSVVHQPVPGLSHARNAALRAVRTPYVAWIDDDELADPDWIHWIRRGFATEPRPDVVSGLMLPAELETPAQVDFERYGGFNKGRVLTTTRLRAGTSTVRNTIYPLPNFGAGGNMAFDTAVLRSVGGFEPHLGAGTLTHGGEETLALSQALEKGATVLHWPGSITWHYHRRTPEALEKQFYGYAAGLSAFYMSLLLTSPRYLFRILMLVPRGLADVLAQRRAEDRAGDALPPDFPPELLLASRRGLLRGAFLYLRERARQHRARGGRLR